MYKTSAATGIVLWFHCGKLLGKRAEGRLSAVNTMRWSGKGSGKAMCRWEHFQTQRDAIRAWDLTTSKNLLTILGNPPGQKRRVHSAHRAGNTQEPIAIQFGISLLLSPAIAPVSDSMNYTFKKYVSCTKVQVEAN